jgi:hypothetical protein
MEITPGKPIRTYAEDGSWRDWSTDELVGDKLNYLPDWKCGAGVDSLYIDMDGFVWTASCRVGGKLGNVFEDFTVPTDWIDCTRKTCSCGADLFVPKTKTIEFKPLLRRGQGLPTEFEKRDDAQTQFVALERTHASNQKQVYWEIGRRCNYDCSYCWPWIHNNTDRHKTLEELMKATYNVEQHFTKGEAVNFIISGGEPTANKDFLDWLPKLSDNGIVLFHDTQIRERNFGVYQFWEQLSEVRPSFEFHHHCGLGVLSTGSIIPENLKGLFKAKESPTVTQSIRTAYERLGLSIVAMNNL